MMRPILRLSSWTGGRSLMAAGDVGAGIDRSFGSNGCFYYSNCGGVQGGLRVGVLTQGIAWGSTSFKRTPTLTLPRSTRGGDRSSQVAERSISVVTGTSSGGPNRGPDSLDHGRGRDDP